MSKFQERELQDLKQLNLMIADYAMAVSDNMDVQDLHRMLKDIKGFLDAKIEYYEEEIL